MSQKTRIVSLTGSIVILHLLCWLGVFLGDALLAEGGVVHVDDSNRQTVIVLDNIAFALAYPLIPLVAARGFDSVAGNVAILVGNSILVGCGLSGAIRMAVSRQYGLKTLFLLVTAASLFAFALRFRSDLAALLSMTTLLAWSAIAGNVSALAHAHRL